MANLGIAGLVWAVAMGMAGGGDDEVGPASRVRLHLVLHVAIDTDELALARDTSQALLAAAGVTSDWAVCSALEGPCLTDSRRLTVRLLPTRSAGQVSGHLVRDHRHGSTALVHVPAHRDVLRRVRTSSTARANPALASLRLGHFIGLTIAHEVGHALGLRHTGTGIMRERAGFEELLALRRLELEFLPEQAAQMARALEGAANQVTRQPED